MGTNGSLELKTNLKNVPHVNQENMEQKKIEQPDWVRIVMELNEEGAKLPQQINEERPNNI